MKTIVMYFLVILSIFISCNPQKRLTKIIEKNPALVDTVTVIEYQQVITQRIDTIVEYRGADTIRSIRFEYDTLRIPKYITKNIIKTVFDNKQLNRLRKDSLRLYKLNNKLEKDLANITAKKEIKIEKSKNSWINYLFLLLAIGIIGFIVKTIYKK